MGNAVDELLSPVDVVDPRVGTTLAGRYELTALLGRGGMGTVYEARHLVIEKPVAVKLLRADLAMNAEQVARFRREATAAAAIGHPNIIDVLDMGRAEDGAVFLVMERLEGQDWSEALEESTASVGEVVRVVTQVLDGLGAAHEAGILHRDLKPANVFVCRDGTVKLLDFGVSKVVDATALSTSTGVAMGTPAFMSPEQIRDSKSVDARADLYSVGVMLFFALTGRYPFEGQTVPELAYKIVADTPPRVKELRPDAPDALDALVALLLAKEPDDRPQTCDAVKRALIAAVGGPAEDIGSAETLPATPSMAPPPEPSPPAPSRSALPFVAAFVLLALGIGGVALTWSPDAAPAEPPVVQPGEASNPGPATGLVPDGVEVPEHVEEAPTRSPDPPTADVTATREPTARRSARSRTVDPVADTTAPEPPPEEPEPEETEPEETEPEETEPAEPPDLALRPGDLAP